MLNGVEIWHNPRCSKSRAAKKALDGTGREHTERRYLDEPPTAAELDDVLRRLDLEPWEVARTGEPIAKELGLAGLEHDRDAWIALMVEHPVLIERPIVLTDDGRAYIARSPESLDDALG
ncbi:MAG: arsenate reductase family protein [Streptosporangiales bacterium]|nr:arsenate reductase family protein [Streptosporangiales bacterium]